MNKKLRPELMLGILLAALWLLLKILPRSGILMSLLLIAAIALVALGLVPESLYKQAKDKLKKIFGKN